MKPWWQSFRCQLGDKNGVSGKQGHLPTWNQTDTPWQARGVVPTGLNIDSHRLFSLWNSLSSKKFLPRLVSAFSEDLGVGRQRESGIEEKWRAREQNKAREKNQCLVASRWELRLWWIFTVQRSNDFRNVFPTVLNACGIVFQEIKYIKAPSLRA